MSTAGPNSPATVVDDGNGWWSDPGNAAESDDTYATASLTSSDPVTGDLIATDFGFSIPIDATISRITAETEIRAQGVGFGLDPTNGSLTLYYLGSTISGAYGLSASIDSTDAYYEDAAPDLWGTGGLTPAQVNDSTFGVSVSVANGSPPADWNLFVDHIRLTVEYSVGGVNYTLTADGGSFTLTGTAVGLKRGRRLVVGSGAFALTGQALTLKQGHKLGIGSGSFSLAGQAVTLSHGRPLTIGSGSFTLTGSALTLKYGRRLVVGSGSFAFTGSAVSLLKGYSFAAGSGTFTLTGQSITFPRSYRIAVGSGSFSLVGQAVGLKTGYRLPVGSGAFAFTGQALNFLRGKRVVIGSGSFALTGQALAFARTKSLLMAPGTFTFTGSDLAFRHSTPLVMGSGTFILTGLKIGPFARAPSVVRVFVPAEAPRWFTAVARSIERELRDRRLLEVDDSTDLPPAEDYRSKLFNIVGLGVVAVSNGTDWIRLDTGATL